jgi:hypothetical protein
MSLNQQVIAEFSPCTPSAPQLRDLSIQTYRPSDEKGGAGKEHKPFFRALYSDAGAVGAKRIVIIPTNATKAT